MSNPVFSSGENSLIFPKAPRYPVRAPRERIQAVDRTAAGGVQVENLGGGINRRIMDFGNLPAAFYAALINWFDVVANGAANAFTVTDEDENEYTARWMNGFDFVEDKAGYSGSIELEIIG